MRKVEPKRLITGALDTVWRGPPSRGWCFFSIHLGERMQYCGRYLVSRDSRASSIFVQ